MKTVLYNRMSYARRLELAHHATTERRLNAAENALAALCQQITLEFDRGKRGDKLGDVNRFPFIMNIALAKYMTSETYTRIKAITAEPVLTTSPGDALVSAKDLAKAEEMLAQFDKRAT